MLGSRSGIDSTICQVYGHQKQGATLGYTKVRGYHSLLAFRVDNGEVLAARMRKASANTARGMKRSLQELAGAPTEWASSQYTESAVIRDEGVSGIGTLTTDHAGARKPSTDFPVRGVDQVDQGAMSRHVNYPGIHTGSGLTSL